MSPVSPETRRQRRVLRRFGHLLALTGDLERNASDKDFLEGNDESDPTKRIYYVFDENLFEFFIHPSKYPDYCGNFYTRPWTDGPKTAADGFSSQAGLIAAEYLFSGKLPGMMDGDPIFMTRWHSVELQRRMRELRREAHLHAKSLFERSSDLTPYLDQAGRMARMSQDGMSRKDLDIMIELSDRSAAEDVKRFLAEEEDAIPGASRFLLARELAASLIKDDTVEPLRQLRRYYSDILPKIRPLTAQFPTDEDSNSTLKDLIYEWIGNLESHYGAKARGGRVQYDARAIAMVQWVAKYKLNRNERIVLVTGDAQLLAAYRNWYRQRDVGEAFLLRSVNQYAPLMNPHDLPNDLQTDRLRGHHLFDSVKVAIDAPVSTFNLATRSASREHLVQKLGLSRDPEKEPSVTFFTHSLREDWWIGRDNGFRELRDRWQLAERQAIGTSLPMLAERLEGQRGLLKQIESRHEDMSAAEAFRRYLQHLLDDIIYKSMQIDIPDAVDFLAKSISKVPGIPRAPMEVAFELPFSTGMGGKTTTSFVDLSKALARGDRRASTLLHDYVKLALRRRPDVFFAITAALALRTEAWAEAERFADNAIKASDTLHMLEETEPRGDDTMPIAGSEYRYLHAIARRFVLGSQGPRPTRTGQDLWREPLVDSIEDLTALETHHQGEGQARFQLRAIAERAAIRLFYVTWGAVTDRAELEKASYDSRFAGAQANAAFADIRRALQIAASSGLADEGVSVARNISINAAALAFISQFLARHVPGIQIFTPVELTWIDARISDLDDATDYPAIVQLDILAFRVFVLKRDELRADLAIAARMKEHGRLAIDSALARFILREIGES